MSENTENNGIVSKSDDEIRQAIAGNPAGALSLALEEVAAACGLRVELWEASDTQIRVTFGAATPAADA